MKFYFGKKWYVLILWVVFPFVCLGLYFLSIYKKPFILAGKEQKTDFKFSLIPVCDKIDGGNSECYLMEGGAGIRYRYTLRNKVAYSYAGVWYTTAENTWFDLSGYDYVKAKVKMSSENWMTLSIATHIPEFSADSIVRTHKYLNHVLPVGLQEEEKILSMKDFSTPVWWYNMNGKKENDFIEADLSKVKYIVFIHSPNNDIGTENKVAVSELGFYVDYVPYFYASAIALAIYFALSILLFYFVRRKLLKRSVLFSYNKVESFNHNDREEAIVLEFLTTHFSTSELTIADIQTATGISERKISAIVKNKSGAGFKQFLNQLRIGEAKKLLTETELPIVEIAFRCGYGSASHFNRIFKSAENCSPNDFRKSRPLVTTTD